MKRFKKGAASFYIVSFSTLILVIIAASFATVIISEVTRASNDDLSQSAYDAALAGVEDAKLAYSNYRRCAQKGGSAAKEGPDDDGAVSCEEIIYWMENPDCDMVAHMIGRLPDYESGEVLISDTTATDGTGVTSDLNQAYTCVKIGTELEDYRANLTSTSNYRLVKVSLVDMKASDVESIKFSWYSTKDGQILNYSNFDKGKVKFQPVGEKAQPPMPPTIEIQLVQTAESFTLGEVNGAAQGVRTDRATLFLVPARDGVSKETDDGNHIGVYDEGMKKNIISAEQVAKTNDQYISNMPYVVKCDDTADFLCSTLIELPDPIGGDRNDDTFMFLVTLPYGEPDTDFAVEFFDEDGERANVDMQVVIDSTGRTNDLYRRVETRLESLDVAFPFIYYALQILDTGKNNTTIIEKAMEVLEEYNRDYTAG